jgi:hypothetical protein
MSSYRSEQELTMSNAEHVYTPPRTPPANDIPADGAQYDRESQKAPQTGDRFHGTMQGSHPQRRRRRSHQAADVFFITIGMATLIPMTT